MTKALLLQFRSEALSLAKTNVCASCICHKNNVCPCADDEERTQCKYFHYEYQAHYFGMVTNRCCKEKQIKSCIECDEAPCCPHGYIIND